MFSLLAKRLHPYFNSKCHHCLTLIGLTCATMMLIFCGMKPESYYSTYLSRYMTVGNLTKSTLVSSQLGNLMNFRYSINSDKCGEDPVFGLLLVGSHPDHRAIRNVFRQTWEDPSLAQFPFKLIFPFGQPVDPEDQLLLEIESAIHGDIVQGNFVDAYHNVTIRDLMGTRWAWQHCPQAKFVIHVDDDMSVDVYALINSLRTDLTNQSSTKGLIACVQTWYNAKVNRYGRYSVNRMDYHNDTFDPYCLGWLYVFNPVMAQLLDKAALTVTPFWMNDAYITGTLVRVTGHRHQTIQLKYAWDAATMRQMGAKWNVRDGTRPTYSLGPQGLDVNLTLSLHHKFMESALLSGLAQKVVITPK